MKRFLVLFITFLFLAGCSSNSEERTLVTEDSFADETNQTSSSFDSENDRVISSMSEIVNKERLTRFIKNFEDKKPDKIIVESYTIEGDPIYQTLTFDGEQLELILDYSEDTYANSPNIATHYYDRIIFTGNEYLLQSSDREDAYTLIILSQEDGMIE